MRHSTHNPEYCCCDISTIFLPAGQVLIPGQLHAQVVCCNCIAEDSHPWFVCYSLGHGATQLKTYNQLKLQGLDHVILTFIFYQRFAVLQEHPWNYTATFFSACLGFCWRQAVLQQPGDEYR